MKSWDILINKMLKYAHESFCRDSQPETPTLASNGYSEPEPTFSEDKVIPFQFTIKMPKPRYFPEILKRDCRGKIVKSEFPSSIV